MKVYNKRGNTTLKEKAMVRELEKAVTAMQRENPDFSITPANNPAELEDLYNQYVVSEAQVEEFTERSTNSNETSANAGETSKANASSVKEQTNDSDTDSGRKQIDPFNREEPIIRDYVMEGDFDAETIDGHGKTSFDEPMSFDDSFTIPEAGSQQPSQGRPSKQSEPEPESQPSEPMNPNFNDMDSAKQRKKTKRFAKQIVNLTATLIEVGFVWYVSKDINEAKLAEYELNGEMDLSLLLDMPDGQKATVKEFFIGQLGLINEESKINEEDREDLTDALTEVMLEKGIAPTPTQELLLVVARVVGVKMLSGFAISQSNKSILNQLRGMKNEQVEYEEPAPAPSKPPRSERKAPVENDFFDNYTGGEIPNLTPTVPEVEAVMDIDEIMFPVTKTKE
jgi:hypothetical protein